MTTATVGWFLPRTLEARAVWFDPARYVWQPGSAGHSAEFQQCPAYRNFTRNLYVIRSPFDLHLTCKAGSDGCELDIGDQSSIRRTELARIIKVHPQAEWREADKPLFQLMLNYYFISDDDVDVQYLSPLTTTYYQPALPGLVLQGRWNIRSWVRPVNFVFEWWDTQAPLIIKRGRPLLNLLFHPARPDAKVSLIEAQETEEVIAMAQQVRNINSYIRNVFSVLPVVAQRRPKKLVKPCDNSS